MQLLSEPKKNTGVLRRIGWRRGDGWMKSATAEQWGRRVENKRESKQSSGDVVNSNDQKHKKKEKLWVKAPRMSAGATHRHFTLLQPT